MRRSGGRPAGPVDGVLEDSRDRAVVLGGGEQDRVGFADGGEERVRAGQAAAGLVLIGLVEGLDGLEAFEDDELGAGGSSAAAARNRRRL